MSNTAVGIAIRRIRPEAVLPRYQSALAAGMDLHACLEESLWLQPGQRCLVPTGLALALPAGYEGQVRSRSGLALKHGIACLNAPGTIDADYRGELSVLLINHGQAAFQISPGDRIAQLVVARCASVEWLPVDDLPESQRAGGGFGSTGH